MLGSPNVSRRRAGRHPAAGNRRCWASPYFFLRFRTAATTAAVAATASYLAFARAPGTPRPWITMGVGAAVTTVTCVGRVRSGEHFPTDVIAGAMAGFGIGILVPHSHRAEAPTQRPIWIGAAPIDDGGIITVSGTEPL